MTITAEQLNHLNAYARTCEQLSAAAASYLPLGDPERVEEMVRTLQDVLEQMDVTIAALLAPAP